VSLGAGFLVTDFTTETQEHRGCTEKAGNKDFLCKALREYKFVRND